MQEKGLKTQAVNGMLWNFSQRMLGQVISFFVTVILARRLTPDDYGTVALAGMFIVLLGIFSDGGLGQALIQKKDADELDYDTMFVSQFVLSSFMYVVIFFAAPLSAKINGNDQLTSLIRVMAMLMPLGALAGVQSCVVTRRLMFKWFFYTSLASTLVSAIVGISMAYLNYGAWALVGQSLTSSIVSTGIIFCLLDWHPRLRFSYQRFRILFLSGMKFMGTSLVSTFVGQMKGYAIGIKYSAADLAYYNRGEGLPQLVCNNIDSTIQSVLFPVLSKIQNDSEAVRKAISRSIRTSTFILMPSLFGLAAISDKLIIIIYSEKWIPSIPYMQVLCFCLALGIMCSVNLQALRATGHIGTVFKLEFIKKPIMLLIILGTMMISPLAIAYGILVFNVFVYFVNSYPNKKYINYSYREQLIDVGPNILLALFMAAIVYLIGRIQMNIYLAVIVQILSGAIIYASLAYLTRNESLYYLIGFVKERWMNKKHE